MNKIIMMISALFIFSSVQAKAEKTSIETLITCQQDDGDQWIEVAIALNDGPGLRAYVVAHDEDDESDKLIAERLVTENSKNDVTVYEDKNHTLRLTIMKKGDSLVGNFALLQEGSSGIQKYNLPCYEKSTIMFER